MASEHTGEIYRAALIGCGSMGSFVMDELEGRSNRMLLPFGHAAVLKTHPRTRLVAGADPDQGRLADFGRRWSVANLYADHVEMLERERPEIVSIASPPALHPRHVVDCASRGVKGIFCEKPIAPTLREADAMIDACAANGVRLSINHTRRGEPYYRRARQLVEEGAIGKVLTITTTWWGRLFLSGSHLFDLVNYFVDDVATAWLIGHTEEPTAQMPVMPTLRGQDVGGTAYVVYQNGVRAFFNGRDGNAAFRTDIFGSKGLIALDSYEAHLWQEDEASRHRELVQRPFPQRMYFTAPMVYLLEDLVGAIEQGGNTVSSGEAARHALAQIVATHFSSEHGNQKVIFPFDQLDMSPPFRW